MTHIWHEKLKCKKLIELTGLSFIYNLNLEKTYSNNIIMPVTALSSFIVVVFGLVSMIEKSL